MLFPGAAPSPAGTPLLRGDQLLLLLSRLFLDICLPMGVAGTLISESECFLNTPPLPCVTHDAGGLRRSQPPACPRRVPGQHTHGSELPDPDRQGSFQQLLSGETWEDFENWLPMNVLLGLGGSSYFKNTGILSHCDL